MVERNESLWHNFIASGEIAENVNSIVRNSWERCQEYNINPAYVTNVDVLTESELRHKAIANQQLISVANSSMESLFNIMLGMRAIVLLADAQGYILRSYTDEGFQKQARKVMLCEGANWSEQLNGTNAIGTSLIEQKPVAIIGSEHFIKKNHTLACIAAPIFDLDGQLVATLDVTGHVNGKLGHFFQLVKMAASNIENQLKVIFCQEKFKLQKAKYDGVVELIKEGTLFIDHEGTICEINPAAAKVLGLNAKDLIGKNVQELYSGLNIQSFNYTSPDKSDMVMQSKFNSNLFNTRTKKICDPNGNIEGIVAIVDSKNDNKRGRLSTSALLEEQTSSTRYSFDKIIGKSEGLARVIGMCKRAAMSNSTVLLEGETGTGKEMLAQSIHQESNRKNRPFIGLNCAAIPAELLESELFGYVEGAFTGARRGGSAGKFEQADGGTLFLDEIGDMPLPAQVSLLRVLQEKIVYRIGDACPKQVDVRIIAATHRNLAELVKKGLFRQDLFFRLAVVNISIPPLRERKEDIALLVYFFFDKFKTALDRPAMELLPQTIEKLKGYSWPGNIRELENTIEGLVNMVEEDQVAPDHVAKVLWEELNEITLKPKSRKLKDIEEFAIKQALVDCDGDMKRVAAMLDIGKSTLYRKIQEYRINANSHFGNG